MSPASQVSIPYERESTSELTGRKLEMDKVRNVSIPYERESTSEHYVLAETHQISNSFNSLRTGKYI